jgi:hypothetical protein
MSKEKNRGARAVELDAPVKSPFPPPPLPTEPVDIRWYTIPVVDGKETGLKEAGPDVKAYLRLKIFGNLDSALAAGGQLLDGPLNPVQRGVIERTMAIVRKARALHNPFEANSPEVTEACVRLETALAEARARARTNRPRVLAAAKGRSVITSRQLEAVKAFCKEKNWDIDKLSTRKKQTIANELKRSIHTINAYLRRLKTFQDAS